MWENIIAIHNVLRKKTTKLNCQLVQYWKNKINKENLKKKQEKKRRQSWGKNKKKSKEKNMWGKLQCFPYVF
jgi:hypothetical protein